MKKLMITASVVAVALGLRATPIVSESFEDSTEGSTVANGDYWAGVGDNTVGTVAAGKTDIDNYCVPDEFKGTNDTKVLNVKTTFGNPLTYKAGASGTALDTELFFDSLVKLTVCDEAPDFTTNYSDAKIILWLQEMYDTNGNPSGTNLYVRAGKIDESVEGKAVPTTFLAACGDVSALADSWHRLTIKAIKTIYTSSYDARPGFVMYIDGSTVNSTALADGGSGIDTSKLLDKMAGFNQANQLFPSLKIEGTGNTTVNGVAFDGQGSVDDLVFTEDARTYDGTGFGANPNTCRVTWDTDQIASLKVDGAVVDATAGTYLVQDLKSDTVTVSEITFKEGYMGQATQAFTVEDGSSVAVVATVCAAKITIGETTTSYATVAEAVTALNGATSAATLKLMANCGPIVLNNGEAGVTNTIDLAGKKITGEESTEEKFTVALKVASGTVIIIDTVTGGEVAAGSGDYADAVEVAEKAAAIINAGIYTGAFNISGEVSLNGGYYSFIEGLTPPAGKKWVKSETLSGYYELAEITYATLTITPVDNCTIVVMNGTEAVETGAKFDVDAKVKLTVTRTPAEGYELGDGCVATEEITMDEDKTVTAVVVKSVTYVTLTITQVENCKIVVSNATAEVETGTKFDQSKSEQLTVYRAPADGYELDGYAATEIITMNQDQTVTAAVKKKSGDAPIPGSGSETSVTPVEGKENTYKLAPTGEGTTVVVDNVKEGDTLIVDANVTEIGVNGGETAGATIQVKNSSGNAVIPNAAMKGWEGNKFNAELDPEAVVVVAGENVPVTPTIEAAETTEGTIADGAVATKAIPGLTYTLKRMTTLGGVKTDVASETATEGTVSLKDSNKPTDQAFYVIEVTK